MFFIGLMIGAMIGVMIGVWIGGYVVFHSLGYSNDDFWIKTIGELREDRTDKTEA